MTGWKAEHTATIVAAAIVGGAILAGSAQIRSALDETTGRLDGIRAGLAETREALKQAATAPQQPAGDTRRRGPDPGRRYTISTDGSPAKGPATAPVVIAEFSDFQ